jgi:hypothetical protein
MLKIDAHEIGRKSSRVILRLEDRVDQMEEMRNSYQMLSPKLSNEETNWNIQRQIYRY